MSTSSNNSNKQNNQFLDDIYADIKRKQKLRRYRTAAVILTLYVVALVGSAIIGWNIGDCLRQL